MSSELRRLLTNPLNKTRQKFVFFSSKSLRQQTNKLEKEKLVLDKQRIVSLREETKNTDRKLIEEQEQEQIKIKSDRLMQWK